jgi:hypothetical protein
MMTRSWHSRWRGAPFPGSIDSFTLFAETDLIVPEFAIPDHWPRSYGLDIRGNTVAAIWGTRDPKSDVVYLYSEYLAESDPAIHAAAIRSRADWIPGLIDPQADGRSQADGNRLIRGYRDLGLRLTGIGNPVESGILEVWQRLHSGRLKVFASLSKTWRNAGCTGAMNEIRS